MGFLSHLDHFFRELLIPPLCCHCQKVGSFLCQNCYEQLILTSNQPRTQNTTDQLNQLIYAGPFQGVLKSLILGLKYKGHLETSRIIAQLLFHTISFPSVELITFVPAHSDRIIYRGFNQSALIAQKLAALLKIEQRELLIRTIQLSPQASISHKTERHQRQKNTMVVIPQAAKFLHQKTIATILIVDDVFTTGATLNEAARAIKSINPGLKTIGLTVAHA